MALQGLAILSLPFTTGFVPWALASCVLGIGTAMVYPTLLATIGDVAHPSWRASAVGVYRLWRDGGYALGAVLAGVIADALGLHWAIAAVGALTVVSGVVALFTMRETLPGKETAQTRTVLPTAPEMTR
jgi:MFS family permease